MLTVKLVETKLNWNRPLKIRIEVFVKEQNVPEQIEMDEYDDIADHVIALRDGEPVGCGRVFFGGRLCKNRPCCGFAEGEKEGYRKTDMRETYQHS